MTPRTTLKWYFRKYAKPTEQQFAELIDSLFHKGEDTISMEKIDGLGTAIAEMVSLSVYNAGIQNATNLINQLRQDIGSLIARIKAAEDDIDTNSDNIAGHETRITNLEGGIADKANRTELSNYILSTVFTDAVSQINQSLTKKADLTLLSQYATNERVGGIDTRVTALESDIQEKPDRSELAQYVLDSVFQAVVERLEELISGMQPHISGSPGEVAYHDGHSVFMQTLMDFGLVATTQEELRQCMDSAPSFEEVFNTWRKFSHLNAADNAVPSDLANWYYDADRSTVVQPNNSTSYTGFISPKAYSSYDITVRVYSTDGDDDTIGLVAAFAKDSDGKEHTLSFVRTAKGTGATWACVLDIRAFSLASTANGQAVLADKSAAAATSTQSWRSLGTGSVIHMTRRGNVFTASCSQFGEATPDPATEITIDLDALAAAHPVLELFKDPSPWGYSTFSQPNSMYENIAITTGDNIIYNMMDMTVMEYDAATSSWVEDAELDPLEKIGAGRFSFNSVTGKLYYNDGQKLLELSAAAVQPQGTSDNAADTHSFDGLKQVADLDAYPGTKGEIVQYTGSTGNGYTHGYIYEKEEVSFVLPANTERLQVIAATLLDGTPADPSGWYLPTSDTVKYCEYYMPGGARLYGYPLSEKSVILSGGTITPVGALKVDNSDGHIPGHSIYKSYENVTFTKSQLAKIDDPGQWADSVVWQEVETGKRLILWYKYVKDYDLYSTNLADSIMPTDGDGGITSWYKATDGHFWKNPTEPKSIGGTSRWRRINVQPASSDTSPAVVRTVTAASISNNLANVSTAELAANDILIVADIGATPLTYTINNTQKTIHGSADFDIMFRYAGGGEFKPVAIPAIIN